MKSGRISIYDTTLRDGSQSEGVAFSSEDKLLMLGRLDRLGVDYIEGGWPHPSNPKEIEFFRAAAKRELAHARLVAFGSTRRAGRAAARDESLKSLLAARTPAVAVFGKSWDLHVHKVLRTSLEENLKMIRDSVALMKHARKEVIFDAEHYFDGWRSNPDYAINTIKAAEEAGADWVVLCDTNGGSTPDGIREAVMAAKRELSVPFGIHAHNDSDCAVANSLVAVACGASQVHGTVNGLGERCGNANLCSVIPNLKIKMGIDCVSEAQMKELRSVSLFVTELATRPPRDEMAYVGESAFTHKAGVHVHAVERLPAAYEHIAPDRVGNRRRILVSDQAGLATVRWKAEGYGLKFGKNDRRNKKILAELKRLEQQGFHFEGAEASFEMMVRRLMGKYRPYFELIDYRVSVEQVVGESAVSEATLKIRVDGVPEHTVAEGDGPVNALDNALRKGLKRFYPEVSGMRLVDYKVRVINPQAATAAKVRVGIESTDGRDVWSTVGVSENIIDASWQALSDSVSYKLFRSRGIRRQS